MSKAAAGARRGLAAAACVAMAACGQKGPLIAVRQAPPAAAAAVASAPTPALTTSPAPLPPATAPR